MMELSLIIRERTQARPPRAGVAEEGCNVRVEGTYRFPGPREKVYDLLLDQAALQRCIPGCQALEQKGEGQYEATLKVGVAAVRGTFTGQVHLTDQDPPQSYRMAIEGRGGPGFVKGTALIRIEEDGAESVVHVEGDGQLGGPMAGVAQRLLGGVARMMMDQFFGCMVTALPAAGTGEEPTPGDATPEP
jgi:carbon monoxide dehydrogenase subunit G